MRAEPDANGCPPPRQATSDAVGGKGTPALHEKMIRVGGFSDGEARPQRLNRPWTKIDKPVLLEFSVADAEPAGGNVHFL
jgi:hypothetical protein